MAARPSASRRSAGTDMATWLNAGGAERDGPTVVMVLLLDLLLEDLLRRLGQLGQLGDELVEGLVEVGGAASPLGRVGGADDLVAGHRVPPARLLERVLDR